MSDRTPIRFESLGHNCEFAFVLQRLGLFKPTLFSWTYAPLDGLVDLLEADFEGAYEFDNLTPCREHLVRDNRFGINFHTNFRATLEPSSGGYVFIQEESYRRRLHRGELAVVQHNIAKFRGNLEAGAGIYVVKQQPETSEDLIDRLLAQLRRLSAGAPFTLINVNESVDAERVGAVEAVGGELYLGHVRRFSHPDCADDIDIDSWSRLVDAAGRITTSR